MGLRIRFVKDPDYVVPKTEGLAIEAVSYGVSTGIGSVDTSVVTNNGAVDNTNPAEVLGSQWLSLNLNIDLKAAEEAVEFVSDTLEKVDKITNIFVVVLKVIRILSSDLRNIARLLNLSFKIIIKQLKDIIEGLTSVGMYVSIINPDFDTKGKKYAVPINGGFKEFQARVTSSLLNSKDPGAPKFGEGDTVGGVVLAGLAGINDPEMLSNLIHNFKIIGKFFNFKGFNVQPPRGLKAIPGFYSQNGKKKLGVKVTWTHPGEYASGFEVVRNIGDSKGTYLETNTPEKTVIEIYDNKDFNNGEPAEVRQTELKTSYSYIDFDVKDGEKYFYRVYTYLGRSSTKFFEGDPLLRDLKSPVCSTSVSATPKDKIPLSALKGRSILDTRGVVVSPLDLAGEWKSISMKTFLGPSIEKLFDKIDNLSDILDGSIVLGSTALTNYVNFLQKKIKKIIKVIDSIEEIIRIIAQFRFRGTMAILRLPPETGGMVGFSKRFTDACGTPTTPDDKVIRTSVNENPFSGANEKGVMFGMILVYGFPSIDGDYFGRYYKPINGVGEDYKKQIERSQKSVEAVLGLLGLS